MSLKAKKNPIHDLIQSLEYKPLYRFDPAKGVTWSQFQLFDPCYLISFTQHWELELYQRISEIEKFINFTFKQRAMTLLKNQNHSKELSGEEILFSKSKSSLKLIKDLKFAPIKYSTRVSLVTREFSFLEKGNYLGSDSKNNLKSYASLYFQLMTTCSNEIRISTIRKILLLQEAYYSHYQECLAPEIKKYQKAILFMEHNEAYQMYIKPVQQRIQLLRNIFKTINAEKENIKKSLIVLSVNNEIIIRKHDFQSFALNQNDRANLDNKKKLFKKMVLLINSARYIYPLQKLLNELVDDFSVVFKDEYLPLYLKAKIMMSELSLHVNVLQNNFTGKFRQDRIKVLINQIYNVLNMAIKKIGAFSDENQKTVVYELANFFHLSFNIFLNLIKEPMNKDWFIDECKKINQLVMQTNSMDQVRKIQNMFIQDGLNLGCDIIFK